MAYDSYSDNDFSFNDNLNDVTSTSDEKTSQQQHDVGPNSTADEYPTPTLPPMTKTKLFRSS